MKKRTPSWGLHYRTLFFLKPGVLKTVNKATGFYMYEGAPIVVDWQGCCLPHLVQAKTDSVWSFSRRQV